MSVASFRQLNLILRRVPSMFTCTVIQPRQVHTSHTYRADFDDIKKTMERKDKFVENREFLEFNDVVYEPTKDGEEPRPAEICHQKSFIPISPKKMWLACMLVRGLSIDEAITQCEFSKKAAAKIVKDVLIEAQELAIHKYNVEYKSNLWVCDSFAQLHFSQKGMKKQMRRNGAPMYRFSTYCVRLREGAPPKHFYPPEETGIEKLEGYIKEQRGRRILGSL